MCPLISYAPWNEFVLTSSGRVLDIMEARICKENPDDKLGEIQVRGENVMTGYYKTRSHQRSLHRRRMASAPATWVHWTTTTTYTYADAARP